MSQQVFALPSRKDAPPQRRARSSLNLFFGIDNYRIRGFRLLQSGENQRPTEPT
jgi:hypothetical protein